MAGVGKLLKQAQKMQRQMEAVQTELAETILEVSNERLTHVRHIWTL